MGAIWTHRAEARPRSDLRDLRSARSSEKTISQGVQHTCMTSGPDGPLPRERNQYHLVKQVSGPRHRLARYIYAPPVHALSIPIEDLDGSDNEPDCWLLLCANGKPEGDPLACLEGHP